MFIIKKHQQTPVILDIQIKAIKNVFLASYKFISSNDEHNDDQNKMQW